MTDEQFKELICVLKGSTWSNLWPILLTFALGLFTSFITNFFINRKINTEEKGNNVRMLLVRLNEISNDLVSIDENLPISKPILENQLKTLLIEINYLINAFYKVMPIDSLDNDLIQLKSEVKNILYSVDTISDKEIKSRIEKAREKIDRQSKKLFFKYKKLLRLENNNKKYKRS